MDKILILVFITWSFYIFAETGSKNSEKKSLNHWHLYNKNKYFKAEEFYKDGLSPRKEFIKKKRKRTQTRYISDDECFKFLKTSGISKNKRFKKLPSIKQLEFCLKAANYSRELFFHIYPHIAKKKKSYFLDLVKKRVISNE